MEGGNELKTGVVLSNSFEAGSGETAVFELDHVMVRWIHSQSALSLILHHFTQYAC
jgi:hypothetical protein